MLVLQAVTLCLALCIFSVQADYSSASERNLHSLTTDVKQHDANSLWREYGCKNTPASENPRSRFELCLQTMINRLIIRILQHYSPTPLPDHLIITNEWTEMETEILNYIKTYLPQVYADKAQLQYVEDQIVEYVFNPVSKYLNQYTSLGSDPVPQQYEAQRDQIANILKKYIKRPGNPGILIVGSNFMENLPEIVRYLTRYAPDVIYNLDVLTLILSEIKTDVFKETSTGDSTTPVPELILEPSRRIVTENLSEDPTPDSPMNEDIEIEPTIIFPDTAQDPTASEQSTIRQKILECIKESFPHVYADKTVLTTILHQLGTDISSGNEEPDVGTMSLESQLRRFAKEQESKITVDETDTVLNVPEEKVIEIDISPETQQPTRNKVEKVYIINSATNGAAKVSVSSVKPDETAMNPDENVIEIDITPESKQTEREYIVKGDGSEATVSLTNVKPNQDAFVEVTGSRRTNNGRVIELPNNINFQTKKVFVQTGSDDAEKNKKEHMTIPNDFQQNQQIQTNQHEIEIPKVLNMRLTGSLQPTVGIHNDKMKFKEYTINVNNKMQPLLLAQDHMVSPFLIRFYGPLYEKEQNGETLTKEEQLTMNELEKSFATDEEFRRLYRKKFGPPGNIGIKAMLYNMYERDLKENRLRQPASGIHNNGKFKEYIITTTKHQNLPPIQFLHGHNSFPFLIHAYGPLYEKERNGEKLTKEEQTIMNELEKIFTKDAEFRQLYRKKFGLPDNLGIKGMLYNMYKTNLKENGLQQPTSGIDTSGKFKEYITSIKNQNVRPIKFLHEHNSFPFFLRAYGPLYKKERNGETLTKEEQWLMNELEKMFSRNEEFRQLYRKKFGPPGKLGIKAMLYNMYEMDLKENAGKLIHIDPMKNIKFRKVDNSKYEFVHNANDGSSHLIQAQIETI